MALCQAQFVDKRLQEMADEDEVDVLGDFCLNLETDLNHYDAGEFPTQNSELLGDYMQHPWLLDNSQVWYFDHSSEDKNKSLEHMLQDEKKHFPSPTSQSLSQQMTSAVSASKVSPLWTTDDIESLKKGIKLHGENWSKVARMISTKTTLQVKSYVKSHPEVITSVLQPSVQLLHSTPSPPQYVNEVEVSNDDSVIHYRVEDIVNEAEIPATMEEVIASVTTGQPTVHSHTKIKMGRVRQKSLPRSQFHKRGKSVSTTRKGLHFAKKVAKEQNIVSSISNNEVKGKPPVLEGEIIRIQKKNVESDAESDSDIDIGGNDEEQNQNSHICIDTEKKVVCQKSVASLVVEECRDISDKANFKEPSFPQKSSNLSTLPKILTAMEQDPHIDSKCARSIEIESQPVFTFPTPAEEREIDFSVVTDEEKLIHWDFFEGRPSKTPERYIKIRNSIVQEWRRVKPRYLTKTSVRPSLKNCGDVNCISRIHRYLELTGVINFGCEQVQYDRPLPPVPCHRERVASTGTQLANTNVLSFGLLMRARKKKQMPLDDLLENGGYTIRHDGFHEYNRMELEAIKKQSKKIKAKSEDPFQLVSCVPFGSDKPAPFDIKISSQAVIVVDLHSHLCTTEVIGLLGGHYYPGSSGRPGTLVVKAAQPCRSLATGHQCEMCPVSQTEGSERLRSRDLEIVGWYHSHPTFPALPSIRDLHTQKEFQQWFSRQEAPFVGLIINPFSTSARKALVPMKSTIRCITVHDDQPYRHEISYVDDSECLDFVMSALDELEKDLKVCPTLVPLKNRYPYSSDYPEVNLSYSRKVIHSVRNHLQATVSVSACNGIEETLQDFLDKLASQCPDESLSIDD